ncbi:toll/interleukin-1 receptor domain-containing protein [Rubinisphaera sp.]|uniref:toll/interleukin-1 receptor domain-containing protein n=1 Tax=Rubinisphaera sp. TaxID=2024857 RepID=UPI000C0F7F80|nr:toll/interleukin-1 receptor domain-containing protein [Rubinisphaera sp.]MBV09906.1 hypothetical protein [Rubinisphaera sp.]HCS50123.1 hypothetical protein [Planctomycetaceae bacterium]|tara:strand:- start:58 stop:1422 length:1365 start_codon:yes stop_codon:yes gene_type:complete
MSHIFVSYRRDDSNWATDRLIAKLRDRFGHEAVFHDVDDIEPGLDFRSVLENRLTTCSILVAVIGEQWVNSKDRLGKRRLTNPDDWVRIEIESGLSKESVVVIPVVLRPAQMPSAEQVPASLSGLCYRQEVAIFPGSDFDIGFRRLSTAIDKVLRARGIELSDMSADAFGIMDSTKSNLLRNGVTIALGMVLVVVAVVVILSWNVETNSTGITQNKSLSADQQDLDRVIKRVVDNPISPEKKAEIEERHVPALGQPDYSNFEFRFDESIWSFREFHPELVSNELEYQSAMVRDRTLIVVKTGTVNQLRFQARTTGKDLIFSPKPGCPPSHIETDRSLVDTGIFRTQAKHLCIDVSEFEVNQEFAISFRTTYWDAPEEESPWFGAMSYPGCLKLKVISIGAGPNFFEKLQRKKCSSFESPLEDCNDGQWVISKDKGAFLWIMPSPEPHKIYMFFF